MPPFDRISPEHFPPAFAAAMRRHGEAVRRIADSPLPATFANTVAALDEAGDELAKLRNVLTVLARACTGAALQEVEREVRPLLAAHADEVHQGAALYARVAAVFAARETLGLDAEERRLLETTRRRLVRAGAGLAPPQQARLREIGAEVARLIVTFLANLVRETDGFALLVEDLADLAGVPAGVVAAAAETARRSGRPGWAFTLKRSSIWPFLESADNRELRREILAAYLGRCTAGDADNRPVFARIAALRAEKARLLGYPTWAHLATEDAMAGSPGCARAFLERLLRPALAAAKTEAAALQAAIDAEGCGYTLEACDWRYWAAQVRRASCAVDEGALAPYLPFDAVMRGAFALAERLYGVTFTARPDLPVYHPDVTAFEVREADGGHLGVFYLDPFARAGKQDGAWCSVIRARALRDGRAAGAVVGNTLNLARPGDGTPALLSPDEARAMVFHEFGHALHFLLSRCRYRASSESIAKDFVELPSQVLENWALEPRLLEQYARHHATGETIPPALVAGLHAAAASGQGFAMTEYLAAALLDLEWHSLAGPEVRDADELEAACLERIGLIPEIPVRYRTPYFGHAADDGYAAAYYSYAWSMALDADTFAAFTETGDVFDPVTAAAFRELLSHGGGEDPAVLFARFRRRDVALAPLLRRLGFAGGDETDPPGEPGSTTERGETEP